MSLSVCLIQRNTMYPSQLYSNFTCREDTIAAPNVHTTIVCFTRDRLVIIPSTPLGLEPKIGRNKVKHMHAHENCYTLRSEITIGDFVLT
jgi:hypothetical protein